MQPSTSLSVDQQNNVLGDPGKLTKLVKYNIVSGLYPADDMFDQIFLKTWRDTPQSVGGHL